MSFPCVTPLFVGRAGWRLAAFFIVLVLAPVPAGAGCVQGDCVGGMGVYQWPSGAVYSGSFREGQIHGSGQYNHADGSVYVGGFYMGKRHGQGTLAWSSGKKYSGFWYNGLQHGHGDKIWPDGRRQTGMFQQDRFVGPKPQKGVLKPESRPGKKALLPRGKKEKPTLKGVLPSPGTGKPSNSVKGGRTRPKPQGDKKGVKPVEPHPGQGGHPTKPPPVGKEGTQGLPATKVRPPDPPVLPSGSEKPQVKLPLGDSRGHGKLDPGGGEPRKNDPPVPPGGQPEPGTGSQPGVSPTIKIEPSPVIGSGTEVKPEPVPAAAPKSAVKPEATPAIKPESAVSPEPLPAVKPKPLVKPAPTSAARLEPVAVDLGDGKKVKDADSQALVLALDGTIHKQKTFEILASSLLDSLPELVEVGSNGTEKSTDHVRLKVSRKVDGGPDLKGSFPYDLEPQEGGAAGSGGRWQAVVSKKTRGASSEEGDDKKNIDFEMSKVLNEGREQNEKGQYNRAIYSFTCALALMPSSSEAHHGRGMAFLKTGQTAKAVHDFDAALEVDPSRYDTLLARGMILRELKEHKASLRDLSLALARPETGPDPFVERALTFLAMGRFAEALVDLQQALTKEPRHGRTHFVKGLVLAKSGQSGEAVESFNTAIALDPDQASYYFERANAISASGQISQAIGDYDKAIALVGSDADYFFARGYAHQSLNNVTLMCRDLRSACEMGDTSGCDMARKQCQQDESK